MPLMEDIRRVFSWKKKKPVDIDLSRSHVEGIDHETRERRDATQDNSSRSSALITGSSRSGRNRSMAELQRGYDEVMDLVHKISDHLDTQNERTEHMMKWMERMPEALDAIPELSRQNARMLEVLNDYLESMCKRDESLNSTLHRLGESSQHQTEVLGLLQQQLDSSSRTSEQMAETLGSFRDALTSMATTNNRSTEVLSDLVKSNEARDSKLTEMFERTQRWMIYAGMLIGTLAIAAIVLSAFAVVAN